MLSVGLYSIDTSDKRQSKTLILSTNVDLRSLELEFLIAVCRSTDDEWQSKTQFLAICDPPSLIVQSVFDCRLSDMIKERIYGNCNFGSFLHKTLATIYLNLQTMSLSGLKRHWSPLLPYINGIEARGQWFVTLRHVKFRWKVQLSAIETRQISIVNTHKVYNNMYYFRSELQLNSLTDPNLFMTPLQKVAVYII